MRHSNSRIVGKPTMVVGLLSLTALLLACDRGPSTPTPPSKQTPSPTPAQNAQTPDVYVVRGVVKKLPKADDPRSAFAVHHEAIPTFKGKDGTVVGMHEMTMEFPLGPGVTTDGLAIGQSISLTFEVLTGPSMKYYVTKIEPLPEGTKLELKSGG
jgi:Cu/Ag efflux protein CusF